MHASEYAVFERANLTDSVSAYWICKLMQMPGTLVSESVQSGYIIELIECVLCDVSTETHLMDFGLTAVVGSPMAGSFWSEKRMTRADLDASQLAWPLTASFTSISARACA